MLKKINRIKFFKKNLKSQNFDTPLFKIKIFPNETNINKFGFIISKRVDKRAVIRNRTKRILSKVAKGFLGKINGSKDFIIVSKRPLGSNNEAEAKKLIEEVFIKSKILK